MKKIALYAAAVLSICGTASCSKKDSPNNGDGSVAYSIVASNAAASLTRTTAAGRLVWTSGFAYPRKVELEAKQQDLKVKYESTNQARIDLLAPNESRFGSYRLNPGTYREIELKIQLDKNGSDPSLELNGNFTNDKLNLPVRLLIDQAWELKSEADNVTISSDEDFTAATTLDLGQLTEGVTEEMLANARLTDGVILISSNSNSSIYKRIRANTDSRRFRCSFKKFR